MFLSHWTRLVANMIMKKAIPPSKPCPLYIYYSGIDHHVVGFFDDCLYMQTLTSTAQEKILCILVGVQPTIFYTNNIKPIKI